MSEAADKLRRQRMAEREWVEGRWIATSAPKHGAATIYKSWGCRCHPCAEANKIARYGLPTKAPTKAGGTRRLPSGIEQARGDSLPHVAPIAHTALSERRAAIRATAQSCVRHGLDAAAFAELLDVLGLDPAEARDVARC